MRPGVPSAGEDLLVEAIGWLAEGRAPRHDHPITALIHRYPPTDHA